MKIQFTGTSFNIIDDNEKILKTFQMKEWELEFDSLAKLLAIDFLKKLLGITYLDYEKCYEKVKVIK